jgi:hypothetical protein
MERVVGGMFNIYPGYEVLTPADPDGSTAQEDRSRTF